jgi:hypothetical protein
MMAEEIVRKNVQESKNYLWHFIIPISFKYISTGFKVITEDFVVCCTYQTQSLFHQFSSP